MQGTHIPREGQVLSLWSASGPDEDAGEVECGLVSDGASVGSCDQAAPLPDPVDAPLDCDALLVNVGVEGGPLFRTKGGRTCVRCMKASARSSGP